MIYVAFFAGAIGAVGGAIAVIALRNPFYSVLALVVHLVSLAGLFLLLYAQFVAAAQVVVYAGGGDGALCLRRRLRRGGRGADLGADPRAAVPGPAPCRGAVRRALDRDPRHRASRRSTPQGPTVHSGVRHAVGDRARSCWSASWWSSRRPRCCCWSPRWAPSCSPAVAARRARGARSRWTSPGTSSSRRSCSPIGAGGVLIRRSPLVILLCLELMLNAGNLALVAFSRMHRQRGGAGLRADRDGRRGLRGRRRASA